MSKKKTTSDNNDSGYYDTKNDQYIVFHKLIQKYNQHTDRREWALVSKKDNDKVLEWYGVRKPSEERVKKTERRVQYFKHVNASADQEFKDMLNECVDTYFKGNKFKILEDLDSNNRKGDIVEVSNFGNDDLRDGFSSYLACQSSRVGKDQWSLYWFYENLMKNKLAVVDWENSEDLNDLAIDDKLGGVIVSELGVLERMEEEAEEDDYDDEADAAVAAVEVNDEEVKNLKKLAEALGFGAMVKDINKENYLKAFNLLFSDLLSQRYRYQPENKEVMLDPQVDKLIQIIENGVRGLSVPKAHIEEMIKKADMKFNDRLHEGYTLVGAFSAISVTHKMLDVRLTSKNHGLLDHLEILESDLERSVADYFKQVLKNHQMSEVEIYRPFRKDDSIVFEWQAKDAEGDLDDGIFLVRQSDTVITSSSVSMEMQSKIDEAIHGTDASRDNVVKMVRFLLDECDCHTEEDCFKAIESHSLNENERKAAVEVVMYAKNRPASVQPQVSEASVREIYSPTGHKIGELTIGKRYGVEQQVNINVDITIEYGGTTELVAELEELLARHLI